MQRLTMLLINNNFISRIGNVAGNIPNIKCLVLTNNRISGLSDLENIILLRKLEHLSLLDNPVALKQNYRLYIIHKIPTLKTLDFLKIAKKERDDSTAFFKSAVGKALLASIADEKSNVGSESSSSSSKISSESGNNSSTPIVLTTEQKALVRAAIEAAKTKDDIDMIEKHLKVVDRPTCYLQLQSRL